MGKRVENAVRLFSEGAACSQSILAAFGPSVGLEVGTAFKIGAGLGAGFGRKQYLCGAIGAGAIILSLKYGSADPADTGAKERAYTAVREFINAMEAELGASSCRELLGISILTPEGGQEASRQGLFETICKDAVRRVSEYLTGAL